VKTFDGKSAYRAAIKEMDIALYTTTTAA